MEKASNLQSSPTKRLSRYFMFLLAIVVTVKCGQQNGCGNIKQTFTAAKNRKMDTFPFWVGNANSSIKCVSYCHANTNCKSVNYKFADHACELNNVTRCVSSGNFLNYSGSLYYDAVGDTPLYSITCYISCKDLLEAGHDMSGIYTIFPAGFNDGLNVYCDMETNGGGWIVIQRRQDGSVDFYRNWTDYQVGFGSLTGEFWIGNDILRKMTESKETWKLRVDLEDWDNSKAFAEYGMFKISGDNYQLKIDNYSVHSTAGDSLAYHNAMPFTTKDKDNDPDLTLNCAVDREGAWWYAQCRQSNLNGKYYQDGESHSESDGIDWIHWRGVKSLKGCTMKICQSC